MPVNTYYLLLSILFSIISIVTFIVIATFSKKLTILSLFFTVIGIVGYNLVFVIKDFQTIQFLDKDLSFWSFLFGMLCLMFNLIISFFAVSIHVRRKKLIFGAKEKYLNKYFCLVAHNDNMLLFNVKIRNILNDENNRHNKRDIYKLLKKEEKPSFTLVVDGKEENVKLKKKEILYKEKLVGYAFVGSEGLLSKILTECEKFEENNILNKSFLGVFDLSLDMSKDIVMYYDFKINKYVLSKSMRDLLQEKDNYLIDSKYQEKIVSSDLAIYLKKEFNSEFINKYEYRVKTEKGILKFEELVYKDKDTSYDIVRLSSRTHTEVNYLTKANLISDINLNYLDNIEFILVVIELRTIAKILVSDKELGELLTKDYFMLLKDEYLQNKVYKLDKSQFAFLLNKEDGMRIKTDLENNCSLLTSMEIMFDEEKILIENTVSFVNSQYIDEKSADKLINIGLNELYVTSDPYKGEAYSIYQPVKEDGDYRFEDMIIDLNDDDLDEFL
ncbi:MAG TPA: hypothetical protein GX695_01540 [Acholeplasmataceae bacterium]|nr:hypothetical protein [Acholeplasmataceae bacterium]